MGASDRVEAVLRAAGDGHLETLTDLLTASAAMANAIGRNPYWGGRVQPLHVAAIWGQEEIVKTLLSAAANPSGVNDGYGGWSPLLIAIGRGHDGVARQLVDAGAAIGPFEAAALGRIEPLRGDLEGDPALVRRPLRDGTTLLHVAADGEVAMALLSAGARSRRAG